jgi:hypothetical protein
VLTLISIGLITQSTLSSTPRLCLHSSTSPGSVHIICARQWQFKLEYFHCQEEFGIDVLKNLRCLASFKTDGISHSMFSSPPTSTFSLFSTLFLPANILNKDSIGPSSVTLQNQVTAWRIWPLSKLLCCIVKQTCRWLETSFSSWTMTEGCLAHQSLRHLLDTLLKQPSSMGEGTRWRWRSWLQHHGRAVCFFWHGNFITARKN